MDWIVAMGKTISLKKTSELRRQAGDMEIQ
jgi:hypothetical protein